MQLSPLLPAYGINFFNNPQEHYYFNYTPSTEYIWNPAHLTSSKVDHYPEDQSTICGIQKDVHKSIRIVKDNMITPLDFSAIKN